MKFNDTAGKWGIIQDIEKWTNLGDGAISGDTTLLKMFTADANNAFDEVLPVMFKADAKWQYDDPNHTDEPRATTDLVSGQSTYSIVSDEDGNSVLEISAVYIKTREGQWQKLRPVDSESDPHTDRIFAGNSDNKGTPTRYDKSAVGIILDPIPDYASTGGLRVLFSRSPSYFVYTDTTKKPGIPISHRLFSLIPSRDYVAIHKADQVNLLKSINAIIVELKSALEAHMGKRARDERTVMRTKTESSR